MKKNVFIKRCAEDLGISQKRMKEVIEVIGGNIVEGMRDDDGVSPFVGIKFISEYKDPHIGRNPMTGESIEVPGKWRPKVKFGVAVKEALNED